MKLAKTAFLASMIAGTLMGASVAAVAAPATESLQLALPMEQAIFSPLPQRDPLLAAGLSLAVNGAGQFYNHQSEKGWWCLAPVLVYPAAWLLDFGLGGAVLRMTDVVLILGVKVYSTWDAYQEAEKAAKK